MEEKINVGIGDFKVANSPKLIQTIGLGSCVAICLYDKKQEIGGLAHILLPDSKLAGAEVNPLRFADKAIDLMLKQMQKKGCEHIVAKIFGGASMFKNVANVADIGERNIESVKKILKKNGIRIIAEDTGGEQGRSVWFDTSDGSVVVSHTFGKTVQM